jgi:hypothetical protein
VLKFLRQATRGPADNGIPIYVDPVGLQEAEVTMTAPVTIKAKGIPLHTCLKYLLKPLGLTYKIKDGLMTITSKSSEDIDENAAKLTRAKLEEMIELDIDRMPLGAALEAVTKASKGSDGRGIPIFVDAGGLQDAARFHFVAGGERRPRPVAPTTMSPVSIKSKGIPLRTSLEWMVKPLHLMYRVEGGHLTITSEAFGDD